MNVFTWVVAIVLVRANEYQGTATKRPSFLLKWGAMAFFGVKIFYICFRDAVEVFFRIKLSRNYFFLQKQLFYKASTL